MSAVNRHGTSGKRILIVCHYYPPHIGGIEIVAHKQALSLRKRGDAVTVVTFASTSDVPGSVHEHGVQVHRIRALNVTDKRFGIPFPLGGTRLLTRLWREVGGADIVHLHDVFYQSSWVTFVVAQLRGRPVILTQHVALVEHPSRLVMLLQRVVYLTVGQAIFRHSKAIIVYNHNVKEFLLGRRIDGAKITELRNGVDLQRFRPANTEDEKQDLRREFNLPAEKPLVLFVGRFVPKKGFNALFEARHQAYDLIFAGDGAVPAAWKSTTGVHVLGPLNQDRLSKLYRLADIFVFPARGEMLTLVMQEAMASGLPVITSDDPAYREYDLNRKLIAFTGPSPVELQHHIKRVLADSKLRTQMSIYSLSLALDWFDWDANIRRVDALYDKCRSPERPTGRKVSIT